VAEEARALMARGGKRQGAGRPPAPSSTIKIKVTLPAAHSEWLRQYAWNVGLFNAQDAIRRLIRREMANIDFGAPDSNED
jgi:hypothetical protein